MSNNELLNISNATLSFKNFEIKNLENIKDYLFIALTNNQKLLTNGKEIYDVSNYEHLRDIFTMGKKLCAALTRCSTLYVIDLKTNEILFADKNAYHAFKKDETALEIMMKIDCGNNKIYNIQTKKYLPAPKNYEFENSLGNGLYVFKEERTQLDYDKSFYEYKRCIINSEGNTLLKDIEGWVYFSDNHLIIIKDDELSIVGTTEETNLNIKTIKKNETIIAKPKYYNGNIITVERDKINIHTPSFKLLKEIKIENLEEVLDLELVENTLKLLLPHTIDGKQINKHVFVNLTNDKIISHVQVEGYPYWTPTTFVGHDSKTEELKDYYFYDHDFNLIRKISANTYTEHDKEGDYIFYLEAKHDNKRTRQLYNITTNTLKEIDYNFIDFHHSLPYGYGVNFIKETMDFFDENLKIIIPNFDYKKYGLDFSPDQFNFFIINDYLCITKYFIDGYGQSRFRTIIQKASGETILDSLKHQCYPIGNFIQIVSNEQKQFLNTTTGEIGTLELNLPINETGNIDFAKITNFNDILQIDTNDNKSKIKLLSPTKKYNNN